MAFKAIIHYPSTSETIKLMENLQEVKKDKIIKHLRSLNLTSSDIKTLKLLLIADVATTSDMAL